MHRSTNLLLSLALVALASGCRAPGNYPSLAPRPAEAIDPRLPIASNPAPGVVDAATAAALDTAVADARAGIGLFNRLASEAERLVAAAGPRQSEGWIAAQQALSALVAQHGVTTTAAARVDALAADRIDATRWLVPATQTAIEEAAGAVAAINDAQSTTIAPLTARLGL